MDRKLLDLYSDYLLSSFKLATATGMSGMLNNRYSHDQISRFLGKRQYSQKDYWQTIKPLVREIEQEEGVIAVDDTIEEKPHTDESELVTWYYDHSQDRSVKGINLLNFVYHTHTLKNEPVSLPIAFETVTKPDLYLDKKTKKWKRRSVVTKNELFRQRLHILVYINRVRFKYVLNDIWFSSKENMKWIKVTLNKEFVMALKGNRLVALNEDDKRQGHFVPLTELDLTAGQCCLVYLKGLDFPVLAAKQHFTNKDGSTGVLHLVTSDTSLTYDNLTTIYQKRWNVELIHKSLKQNAALERSPTKTITSQSNHIFAAMIAVTKLECLKLDHLSNHFQLKAKLYLKAVKAAFDELNSLSSINAHFGKFLAV